LNAIHKMLAFLMKFNRNVENNVEFEVATSIYHKILICSFLPNERMVFMS